MNDLSRFVKKQEHFKFCDITIITDEGELIAAHKNVLSSTCLYFEAMLNGE